jgi:Alkylmercury lyase
VQACWERLHDAHALVLDPAGGIRMANPFSGVPTAYRVHAGGRWWFGNCAWDAFGICAALHQDGRIETVCADCRQPVRIAVRGQRPDDDSLLFHCLVPAARWWDDIAFT